MRKRTSPPRCTTEHRRLVVPALRCRSRVSLLAADVRFVRFNRAGEFRIVVLLTTEGRKAYDAGVSAGRAAAELDLGKYASWTDVDRVAPNMARLYGEFAGTIGTDIDRGAAAAALAEYREITGRE